MSQNKTVYLVENWEKKSPKWILVAKDDIFPYVHWLTASHFFSIRKNVKENFKTFCDEKGYIQGNCF